MKGKRGTGTAKGSFVSRKERRKQERQDKKQRRNWKEAKAREKVQERPGRQKDEFQRRGRKRPRPESRELETQLGSNFVKVLQENNLVGGYRAPEDDDIEYLERKLGLRKGDGSKGEKSLQRGLDSVGLGALGRMAGDIEHGRVRADAALEGANVGGEEALGSDLEEAFGALEGGSLGPSDEEGEGGEDGLGVDEEDEDSEEVGGGGSEEAESGEEEEEDDEEEDLVQHRGDLYGRDVAQRADRRPGAGAEAGTGGKYVPPHLRALAGAEAVRMEGLRRRVRGLLNRLADENVEPIALSLSELYRQYPRGDMNSVVADAAVALVTEGGAQAFDAVCRVVAALVAALHVMQGPEAGGFLLERFAVEFRQAREEEVAEGGDADSPHGGSGAQVGAHREPSRRASSLLLVLGFLYTHGMVQADLVFDLVRLMAASMTEVDVELLLLLLKHVGFRLRADDPQGLLEAVAGIQEKATAAGSGPRGLSVRMQVMVDAIADLRNNRKRRKEEAADSGKRLAKWLNRLRAQHSGAGASAHLRVGWNDLVQADTRGRWWIPGARFVGGRAPRVGEERAGEDAQAGTSAAAAQTDDAGGSGAAGADSGADGDAATRRRLEALARKNHMNTDVRRSIFVALMGAANYEEAVERIHQLGLREVQQREIPRVVLHCCGQERAFNPFYAHVAERVTDGDAKARFTLQLCFWDTFKMLPSMSTRRGANLARMLAQVVAHDALTLAVLKPVDFGGLHKRQVLFFRVFFAALLTSVDEKGVQQLTVRLAATKALNAVRDGVTVFLQLHMGSAAGHKELKAQSRLLRKTLDQVSRLASTVE